MAETWAQNEGKDFVSVLIYYYSDEHASSGKMVKCIAVCLFLLISCCTVYKVYKAYSLYQEYIH